MSIRRMIGGIFATITIIVTGLGLTAAPASALPVSCVYLWNEIDHDGQMIDHYTYDFPWQEAAEAWQATLEYDLEHARNAGCPGA